jgi:hypothetical protein
MGRDVEIATPSFHVGQKLEIQNLTYFYRRALSAKIRFTANAAAVRFEAGRVVFTNPFTGDLRASGPYDSIVVAAPGVPENELAEPVRGIGIECIVIGDAYAPRDVEAAILEGFETGVRL